MKKKTNRILTIIILCLAICLAVIFITDWAARSRESRRLQSLQEQQQPLDEERAAVQEQLEQLKKDYDSKTSTTGTAQILFTDLDERIYTEVAPLMESYGFTGILAVSGTHYPGTDGCMSDEQVNELTEKGWICCRMWEKGDTADDLSDTETSGYSFAPDPDFIYFEEEEYTEDYDTILTESGYRAAIHHGEDGLPLVTGTEEGKIWHPGAVGLQGYQPRFRLEDAVSMGGNIVFTVGFKKEDEMYERDTFLSMLNYLQSYEEDGELQMLDPGQAAQYFADAEEKKEQLKTEFENRKTELEEELRRIEEALDGSGI